MKNSMLRGFRMSGILVLIVVLFSQCQFLFPQEEEEEKNYELVDVRLTLPASATNGDGAANIIIQNQHLLPPADFVDSPDWEGYLRWTDDTFNAEATEVDTSDPQVTRTQTFTISGSLSTDRMELKTFFGRLVIESGGPGPRYERREMQVRLANVPLIEENDRYQFMFTGDASPHVTNLYYYDKIDSGLGSPLIQEVDGSNVNISDPDIYLSVQIMKKYFIGE